MTKKKKPVNKFFLVVIAGCIALSCFAVVIDQISLILENAGFRPTRTPQPTKTEYVNMLTSFVLTQTAAPTHTPKPTRTETPLPTFTFTPLPTRTPFLTATLQAGCILAYPDFCIMPGTRPSCDSLRSNFTVLPPDPFNYDGDSDGVGCEN